MLSIEKTIKLLKEIITSEITILSIICVIISFLVFAMLTGDTYRGIWVGVYIFLFYYLIEASRDNLNKLLYVIILSFFTLIMTTLITNILFYTILRVDYCQKGMFYSKERCALQKTSRKVEEKFGGYYSFDDQ